MGAGINEYGPTLEDRFDALREDVKAMVESVNSVKKENAKLREDMTILNSKVAGYDMQIKAFTTYKEDIDMKLSKAAESWATAGKTGAVDFAGVEKAIQQGFKDLIAYKERFEAKMDARRAGTPFKQVEVPKSIESEEGFVEDEVLADLMQAGIDLNLLYVDVKPSLVTIMPVKFLGDLWSPIMDALRPMGVKWIRDDKNSRWELRMDATTKQAPPVPSQSREDWKPYKSGKPGAWMFSNQNPELAERISREGDKLVTDEYEYKLSGDPNEQGYPKFIGRWRKK